MYLKRQYLTSVLLVTVIVGCADLGDAIISAAPFPYRGPDLSVPARYDNAARTSVPKAGVVPIFVTVEGVKEGCGFFDVWIDDDSVGRVFGNTYVYDYAKPGQKVLRLEDHRLFEDKGARHVNTALVQFFADEDSRTIIQLRPKLDDQCHYSGVDAYRADSGNLETALEGKWLSYGNAYDFPERHAEQFGGEGREWGDYKWCRGEDMAYEHNTGRFAKFCTYEEKPLLVDPGF